MSPTDTIATTTSLSTFKYKINQPRGLVGAGQHHIINSFTSHPIDKGGK